MLKDYVFGYGSLVNHSTHNFKPYFKDTLSGWTRTWRATNDNLYSYLSIIPDKKTKSDGLLVQISKNERNLLDEREKGYTKITTSDLILNKQIIRPKLYLISENRHQKSNSKQIILLSYIDCVIKGFLDHYGQPGVDKFFETTTNWEGVIKNDRLSPLYPRNIRLTEVERKLVDIKIEGLPNTVIRT